MGIDTWEIHWTRLQGDPQESHLWYLVMQRADAHNIDRVVNLAVEALPLDQVATGAANSPGMGPEHRIHRCLDAIVQDLGKYPGKG